MKTKAILTCLAAVIGLGALALGGGCAAKSVNSFQRAQPEAATNYVNDQRIVTDTTLARTLAVRSINEARASGNMLQIQATIENLKTSDQKLRYKFDWIGDNGMAVGDTGWRVLFLRGREISNISAIATNPRAVDFRIKFVE